MVVKEEGCAGGCQVGFVIGEVVEQAFGAKA
jgi:hypothetical protein